MKTKDLSRIILPRYGLKPVKPKIPSLFLSRDTETVRGRAVLIANSEGQVLWPDNAHELFFWIWHIARRYEHNYLYNLQYDALALLSWLDEVAIENLYYFKRVHFGPFRLAFIPRKYLSIRYRNKSAIFYDI